MKKLLSLSSIFLLLTGYGIAHGRIAASLHPPANVKQLSDDATKASSAAQPKIELLQAGAEPRRVLRFQPAVNARQTTTMKMKMNIEMAIDNQPLPQMTLPTTVTTIETTVTRVDANGDIHYQFHYPNIDVINDESAPPESLQIMRYSIKNMLAGLRGEGIIDSRGYNKGAKIIPPEGSKMPKELLEGISNYIGQISFPLPDEPIGIGAQWSVSDELNVNGINVNQIAKYELMNLENNAATLKVNIQQQASPQQQKLNAGLPDGVETTLKSYSGQGEGEAKIRLDELMPIFSTVAMRSALEVTTKYSGSLQVVPMSVNYLMEVNLESK
ncbi:MAG: DUF6263 family protein [Oscillatoriaceae bacterium SKW80]|nr:DUF6263 family protein [Oscillatoriaceae bacterium SKYG93]MCX8121399.1 DUF6263 family protein [Oscillatoriaceae bacterium SKW80]MDW8451924.1 DUF6263 family protein [Oscillatoriaceae cyanobacterium SKYGB_i_bin93]HIK29467.1 hypothetical protein [Oscillatoriaceae cyanobacterium M7585_C2015_266]